MSRERARRRAEREAAAAAARAQRERRAARARRRSAVRSALTGPFRSSGSARPQTALGRRRGRQNGALAAAMLGGHAALWLLVPSWWVRIGALVLTVMAWPLLVVLLFDRRPSS